MSARFSLRWAAFVFHQIELRFEIDKTDDSARSTVRVQPVSAHGEGRWTRSHQRSMHRARPVAFSNEQTQLAWVILYKSERLFRSTMFDQLLLPTDLIWQLFWRAEPVSCLRSAMKGIFGLRVLRGAG